MPTARGHIVIRRKAKDGNDGKGILFVTISYATSDSATRTPTEGWQSVMPEVLDNYYLWTRTVTTYTDGTTSTSYTVSRQGKGVKTVVIMYASSNQGTNPPVDGWQFNIPQVQAGQYLWTRTVTTYTDDTTSTSYAVALHGEKGDKGDKGDPGRGITSVTEYYLASASSSGVTPSTQGWTTSIQTVTPSAKYLWNYERVIYSDGTHDDTTPVIIGTYGDQGNAGKGISSITEYYLASANVTGVTRNTSGWTTSIQTVTASLKYLWNYEKITYTDGTTTYTNPVIIGAYGDKGDKGDPGVGISSVTEHYLASANNSGVTRSTSGWTTSIQTVTASKRYLWNYETITYSDGTTLDTNPVIIGVYGDQGNAGKGITSVTEHYLATASGSGVTKSTSGWTTSVQTVTATKKYLWNYETITYTDGSTSDTSPVIIGVYGDKGDKGDTGVGISSVTEYYLASASSSGVTTSTSGWTTSVQSVTTSKKYLWNYEKITFSDGSTSTTIPAIIGVYGDTGAAGKGISSITEYYLASASSSGVTRSTSGWTTSVQSVTNSKKYLWNYEKIVYTDNTESYTTPVIIGTYGDKGDKGDSGVGIGSITEYYLASASNSGVTTSTSGWTTTVQSMTASKRYLWNYEIVTYSDGTTQSTTPHIIGTYGDTGVGVSSITEYYLASASVTGVTRSTSGWTTAVQTVDSSKKYLWNYEKVTYTDNSTSYTTPVIIGVYGDKGDKGDKGDTGDRGYSGCVYRVTVWQTGKQYRNDQYLNTNDVRYIDICVDQPMAIIGQTTVHVYMCKTTHTSSNSIPLGNTSYWTELQSAAPMFTPFMLAQAISADYINCAEIAANSAFISALAAEQAFIDALVVKTLDTRPSQSGNKIRIDGDGFSLFDSNALRKIKIDNNTVGRYDDLFFQTNINYLSSGLARTRSNSVYVYTSGQNVYFPDELIGHLNLGYCDKGSVIKLNSISCVISPTSTNSNIRMYMNTPQLDVAVFKDGTRVASGTVAASSVNCGMGGSVQISGTLNINYTVTEDGMYTLRIYTWRNSGPVTATSTCYMYSSSGSGSVTISTTTTWKFSLTRSNYEYTHIGNDGLMQVFGNGFLYNSSQEFVVRKSNYMLRISSSGIQKSINSGQTWTSL